MDVLTDVLAKTRVHGGISGRIQARAPWGLSFDGSRPASFHVVVQGACWVRLDGAAEPVQLVQGDVALLPRGVAHVLADAPDRPTVDFRAVVGEQAVRPGTTLVVGGTGAPTVLVCGAYDEDSELAYGLLRALPPLVHLPAAQAARERALPTAVHLLAAEIERPSPGSDDVVSRLVDVLLIYILRSWRERDPASCPGWFDALVDPLLGRAISLIHEHPQRRWTVAALAAEVSLSRAAFARRFATLVGEPPLAYVSRWRMTVAAALLRDTTQPIAVVADRVGYDSEFAFARAFRRAHGVAPGRYRRHRAAGGRAGTSVPPPAARVSPPDMPGG